MRRLSYRFDFSKMIKLTCFLKWCMIIFTFSSQDVDECKEQPNICDGGRCDNLPGSYRCICPAGLLASPDQKRCLGEHIFYLQIYLPNLELNLSEFYKYCRSICSFWLHFLKFLLKLFSDVDECLQNKNLCQNGGCQNTHGSFVCKCDIGFSVKTQIRATGCTGTLQDLVSFKTNLPTKFIST